MKHKSPNEPYSTAWVEKAFVQFGGTVTATEGERFANFVQKATCVGPVIELDLLEAPLATFCGSADTRLSR